MNNFVLLTLATFLTWEMLRALLPWRLPIWSHSGIVLALCYGWTFLPPLWLTLAAVASAVGLLHSGFGFGSTDDHKASFRLHRLRPRRKRVPDLP